MWRPLPEMMWRVEPDVEAARQLPGWGAFHRACGRLALYFDHPQREGGRRGTWAYDAFTVVDRAPIRLSVGRGKTVLEALADAHERSGRATDETRAALAAIGASAETIEDDDFAALLGGAETDEPDDFEGMLG